MGSESKPAINFGAENGTVRELIMMLKSSFQQKDFDKVQQIFLTREENMKRTVSDLTAGIENWKKECNSMEKKHDELVLAKLEVDGELNECRRDYDQLQEKMTRLNEDHRVLSGRSQRDEKKFNKLWEEFKKVESDKKELIFQLKVKTTDLECSHAAKRRAEGEADILKKRFRDMEFRVSRLEEDISLLIREEPLVQTLIDEKLGREGPVSDQNMEMKESSKNGRSQNEMGIVNGSHKLTNLPNKERVPSCHEKVHTLEGAVSACDSLATEDKCPKTSGPHSTNRDCDNGMPIRKQLVFEGDSTSKLMSSSMPMEGNKRHKASDIIEINDSDSDDEVLAVYETACDANIHPSGVILNEKEATSQRVVKSADSSDTHQNRKSLLAANHKRKRSSCNISENEKSDDDKTSNGNRKSKQLLDIYDHTSSPINDSPATPGSCNIAVSKVVPPKGKIGMGQNSTKNVLTETSSDSDSSSRDEEFPSSYMDEIVAKITQRNDNRETWPTEADMISALGRDAELSMNAVCALYRQQNCTKKFMNGYSLPRNRGFNQFDVIRGNTLAKFLIDGDPQGKLKKSVSELQKYNPKGLDDCKNLAIKHSEQLFEIYQKKEDPFFTSRGRTVI